MSLDEFIDLLENVKHSGGRYMARCPAHEDAKQSLQVQAGEKGILVNCFAGCTTQSVVEALGLGIADLFYGSASGARSLGEPEAIYPYVDEEGALLFEAVRFPGKKFRQRHPDPDNPGEWIWGLENTRRVLYRLPEILAAAQAGKMIYLCEGEKDVHNLLAVGVEATCNPMGAGKWRSDYTASLVGATVVIVQDKDEPGRHHAERVRDQLRDAGILVYIVEARDGKDASDHLSAGYGVDDFVAVTERVRRGIVTAREMAANGMVMQGAEKDSILEYPVMDFTIGKLPLAFRPGRMYLLGGYTGDGKTTMMLQLVRSLCGLTSAPKIGVFSMEMSSDDLRNRIVGHWGLPLFAVEHPWTMTEEQTQVHMAALAQVEGWSLEVIFDTALSAETVAETARDRDYDFVFIDHIHRFAWGTERRVLEKEVATLTNLALDFNIPVFVLAQFRNYATGKGTTLYPRPTLQDFKETGSLGQEAALAMAVYRHRDSGGNYLPSNLAEFIVLKNRFGPTSAQGLKLDASRMVFVQPTMEDYIGSHEGNKDPSALHVGAPY